MRTPRSLLCSTNFGFRILAPRLVASESSGYVDHRLRHIVGPFWAFHRTHHTDTDVDVTTSFRNHPFDIVVLNALLAIAIAVAGIGATTVAIVAVTTPVFGLLAHARLRLPIGLERRLARVVQTPGMHRVHHSPDQPQTDSNFGLIFSVWDRVLGTFNPPNPAGIAGLDTLEQAGELTRVAAEVDTDLLITEWADREMKSSGGGKALLFEHPMVDGKTSAFPVAINTMGSRRRMA